MFKKLINVVCSQTTTAGRFFRRVFAINGEEAQIRTDLMKEPPKNTPLLSGVMLASPPLNGKVPDPVIGPVDPGHTSSLKAELSRVVSEIAALFHGNTARSYKHVATVMLKTIPEDVLKLPLNLVTMEHLSNLRQHLATLSPNSRDDRRRVFKRLLKMLMERGLPSDCADVLDVTTQDCDLLRFSRQISDRELATMVRYLPGQLPSIQLLFWLGFSGGMRLSDAVSLRRDSIDPETGTVRYQMQKSVRVGQFILVNEGLECFKKRRYAKGETFVFPEFVRSGKGQK